MAKRRIKPTFITCEIGGEEVCLGNFIAAHSLIIKYFRKQRNQTFFDKILLTILVLIMERHS